VSSFNSIYKQAIKKLESGTITHLSLDVFDTILHRTCPPNAVLDAVNFYVQSECEKLGHFVEIETISWARGEAYLRCANENAALGMDQETHVDDFFPVWMDVLGVASVQATELARNVLNFELYLEEEVLKVDPGMSQLIQFAVSKDIKVIYCSDMYLPARFINSILEKFNLLDLFSGRYVSSETKLLKRTGNLFDYIIKSESVNPKSILHIGDNVVSDYVNSKSKGICGLWLRDNVYQSRRYSLEYDHLNQHNPASFPFLLAEQGRFDTTGKNSAYLVGRNTLGPVYTSFIVDVQKKAVELNVDKVFFLAREGFALKRIYDYLNQNETHPESVYIAGSRILSFLYSVDKGVGLRHLADIFSNTSIYTISNLLAPFAIDTEILEKICQKYGLSASDILPPGFLEWPPFIRIIEDELLNDQIMVRILEHRELYTRYLTQAGLIGTSKAMVVDVGWGGQIQDNLFRGLQITGSEPHLLVGCYLALNEKAHQRKQPNNWKHATHSDKGFMEWNGYSAFDTVFIYEAAVRASHGTVLGLHKVNDEVFPSLKSDDTNSRITEKFDDPYLAELQRGIIDFSASFSLCEQLYPSIAPTYLKPYGLTCISLVSRFADHSHYSWLASVGNVADLGTDYVNVAGATISNGFSFNTLKIIKQSPWKEFVAFNKLGFMGLISISVYRYLRSIPHRTAGLVPRPLFNFPQSRSPEASLFDVPSDNKHFDDYLFKIAQAGHEQASELGRKLSSELSPRELYSIDKLIGYNYLTYRIVNVVLSLRNKHLFYYEGLSFKYVLKRRIYVLKKLAKDYLKFIRVV
tara:strand:+ start:5884 stop:8301 length:2418 start_codon:yes stop_codon:yes gene_type:complete